MLIQPMRIEYLPRMKSFAFLIEFCRIKLAKIFKLMTMMLRRENVSVTNEHCGNVMMDPVDDNK